MPPPEDPPVPPEPPPPEPIEPDQLRSALDAIGLAFDDAHLEQMGRKAAAQRATLERLRGATIGADLAPAFQFDPWIDGVVGRPPRMTPSGAPPSPPEVERPDDLDDLAFASIPEQSALIRERRVSCVELATLAMDRLRRVDPILRCVVTLTAERALAQAAALDDELAAGQWRGPLHGIPWGAKDLLAVAGHPTTWGTPPFAGQRFDRDAAVVRRLDAAGAVLVAKLSLGELAWGDVWTGGRTVNPWDPAEGSSGSSAGSAAAVAAGAVPFAIGSETLGSITSPARICGVTGLRPTFGRVSRDGAMPLSWTMDKLGPMARSAEDCALVFEAIRGRDPRDPATVDAPFPYRPDLDVTKLRVGYLARAFEEDYRNREADRETLDRLRSLGVALRPLDLPADLPVDAILTMLSVEAATAFDALTRTGGIDGMVRQTKDAWPHVFRAARFVPAVEYLQASRARTLLARRTAEALQDVDVFVAPSYGGNVLGLTNLTGHPCVCVPNAFHPVEGQAHRRSPGSITFVGGLYQDAEALALAAAYQQATDFHRRRPPLG
jgi:Asp-tRNA(Asn)/Glu-tRNA(Gln) amidotransferase A subunit family amidase